MKPNTWYQTETYSEAQPPEFDTTSSKVYNYARKDFERVEETDPTTEETRKKWVFQEQKIKKEDWNFYQSIMANKKAISLNDGGLEEIADIISNHDEAIMELANIVSDLIENLQERNGD